MDWGMKNRLNRIIKPATGRTVMLALDHGYFLGPVKRLENVKGAIEPLIPYADALMLTRGILRASINPDFGVPVVLRVSGGNSTAGSDLSREDITVSMEDAVRLNASAVAISIYVGAKYEHQTLVNLGKLVDSAYACGMPVLAVTAVGRELEKRDAKYLSLACRIAAELGAVFVKTYYCDGFEKVSGACPVPLVIAGGPRMKSPESVLQTAYNAVCAGACGVDMGRNVWQAENPCGMIKAIRHIVHNNGTVEEAVEIVKDVCKV